MKKLLLFLIVFLLITFNALYPSIAFKTGINNSNMHFKGVENQNWGSLNGMRIGGFLKSDYSIALSLQPEIYFVTKGVKANWTFLGMNVVEKIKLNYIEVPILLRYSIISKLKYNIGILAGVYFAFNLTANQITTINNERIDEDINNDIENWDYGGIIGVEIFIKKKNYKIYFDLRLTQGLTNIREELRIQKSMENYSLSFMIGLGF